MKTFFLRLAMFVIASSFFSFSNYTETKEPISFNFYSTKVTVNNLLDEESGMNIVHCETETEITFDFELQLIIIDNSLGTLTLDIKENHSFGHDVYLVCIMGDEEIMVIVEVIDSVFYMSYTIHNIRVIQSFS